ncbi:MAG: glycosyltransferase [Pirellulales bacterium]|nr:glycosyltransferase [Pirellulales bacterium]
MKILACHNHYQQPGGEDQSFAAEVELLQAHGHEVSRYVAHNDSIRQMGRLEVSRKTIFNRETYREIRIRLRKQRPDVVHCTNVFPLISPAVYYAARKEKVAVVQSLRNFRLLCPNAYLLRDGKVCEDCLTRIIKWPAVRYGCYRNNRAATAVVATMLATHRWLGTWTRMVDRYFAMTEFARQKFVDGGLPAAKIDVKPNFLLKDPGPGPGQGGYALFVGRLSPEKGLDTLLAAWRLLERPHPLRIAGDGPLAATIEQAAGENANIQWLGRLHTKQVLEQLGNATCLVLPSAWYEGLPRTIIEAYAKGTPVIAFRLGAMQEVIQDGRTGYLVQPGNVEALARTVEHHFASDPPVRSKLRQAAYDQYRRDFSAENNYRILMEIYRRAIEAKSPGHRG